MNFFQAAAYQLALLVKSPLLDPRDFIGIKVFCVLGSIVSEHLRKEFRAAFPRHPLIIAYGMSESCISISATQLTDSIEGLTVGRVSSNVNVRVVDEEGNALEIGQTGEILAKPEFKFMVSTQVLKKINNKTLFSRDITIILKRLQMLLLQKDFLKQEILALSTKMAAFL